MAGIYPRPLEFGNFVVFFCALILVVVWSSCAGLMFGIIVPDAASAGAISMPFILIQILFSGFYLTKNSIPPWFIWAYHISFFRYSLAILVKNLFHTLRFTPCHGFCPFGTDGNGRDVEKQYGVQGNPMVMLFGVCIGYTAIILLVGYVALVMQLRAHVQRKASRPAGEAVALGLPPHALAFSAPAQSADGDAAAAQQQRKSAGSLLRRREDTRAQA